MDSHSPSKSQHQLSFGEATMGPTPRQMAAAHGRPTPQRAQIRRCSSIPRPTSKFTASPMSPARLLAVTTTGGSKKMAKDSPQTLIKPRAYSRSRRGSFMLQFGGPLSSGKTPQASNPRLSLPANASLQADSPSELPSELSSVHQQLPVKHYSCRSLASLDTVSLDTVTPSATVRVSENNTTTSLPLPGRLTKTNTSSTITKETSPIIPQRHLLGPLGPPMPRSQTMGNFGCFAGSVDATPSPSKSTTQLISIPSEKNKNGVRHALGESRLTDEEIEYINKVAREFEAKRQKVHGSQKAIPPYCNDRGNRLASSKPLTSLTISNRSSDHIENKQERTVVGHSSRKLPARNGRPEISTSSNPSGSPTVLTPDSGISMSAGTETGLGVNLKHVYFAEPVRYWQGRFSTVCDRLRSEAYIIHSSNFASASNLAGRKAPHPPKTNSSDSFEQDETWRMKCALVELRSCCQTAEAMRSFEKFEQEVLAKHDEVDAQLQRSSYTHSTASKAGLLTAGFRPKILACDSNISAPTMKIISSGQTTKPLMTRSKTMGNLGHTSQSFQPGASGAYARAGWRRPSYLKAQEEVLASEMAINGEHQREASGLATAHRRIRRSPGAGVGVVSDSKFSTQDQMLPPAKKPTICHNQPRKSSGASAGNGSNADLLKRVFSEGVRSVRRMGKSLTGLNGSGDN